MAGCFILLTIEPAVFVKLINFSSGFSGNIRVGTWLINKSYQWFRQTYDYKLFYIVIVLFGVGGWMSLTKLLLQNQQKILMFTVKTRQTLTPSGLTEYSMVYLSGRLNQGV